MVERWSPVSEPRPYTAFRNTVHSRKRVNVEQSDLGDVCIQMGLQQVLQQHRETVNFNERS